MIILVFIFTIILIYSIFLYKESFTLTTGVAFPDIPGTIEPSGQDSWVFKPMTGYFGPVKINYKLSDTVKEYPNSLLLTIQRILDQPVPLTTSAPISTNSFDGAKLFSIISLRGGEFDQNYNKYRVTKLVQSSPNSSTLPNGFLKLGTNRFEPSQTDLGINETLTYNYPTNSQETNVSVEFYLIDSTNVGKTVAPDSSELYRPSGPFYATFTAHVCPQGSVYSSTGCKSCLDIGRYSDGSVCKSCGAGTISNGTSCVSCPSGFLCNSVYWKVDGIPIDNDYTSTRTPCKEGSYCTGGSSVLCPVNSYCPAGSGGPIQCPADRPTAPAGSKSNTDCTGCVVM